MSNAEQHGAHDVERAAAAVANAVERTEAQGFLPSSASLLDFKEVDQLALADASVLQWLRGCDLERHASVLSLGEMLKGIHLMERGNRRHEIEQWYHRIDHRAAKRLVTVDGTTLTTWGRFEAKHQLAGRKLPLMDSLLASASLRHGLDLVTRHTGDFPQDVAVLNPFGQTRWRHGMKTDRI